MMHAGEQINRTKIKSNGSDKFSHVVRANFAVCRKSANLYRERKDVINVRLYRCEHARAVSGILSFFHPSFLVFYLYLHVEITNSGGRRELLTAVT